MQPGQTGEIRYARRDELRLVSACVFLIDAVTLCWGYAAQCLHTTLRPLYRHHGAFELNRLLQTCPGPV